MADFDLAPQEVARPDARRTDADFEPVDVLARDFDQVLEPSDGKSLVCHNGQSPLARLDAAGGNLDEVKGLVLQLVPMLTVCQGSPPTSPSLPELYAPGNRHYHAATSSRLYFSFPFPGPIRRPLVSNRLRCEKWC